MNMQQVVDIGTSTLMMTAKLAGPFLMVFLGLGLIVGLMQSVTQIQEQTLSFVPKLIGAGAVVALGGNWMLVEMVAFARELISSAPTLIDG